VAVVDNLSTKGHFTANTEWQSNYCRCKTSWCLSVNTESNTPT